MSDRFDSLSPIDYRYWDEEVAEILSEEGFTRYKLGVELALVEVLSRRGLCPDGVVDEVSRACAQVTTAEVYEEEARIRHDIRALVNCIRTRVSERARPYIHMLATSYDISDTANAARYRDVVIDVLVPALRELAGVLIDITLREADTVQIGRTHGQHAVPITFGFAIASFVSRLGGSIVNLTRLAEDLRGKFSGAVGAYNASSLFLEDPESFEAEILGEFGLAPAEHSTQIVPPEAMARLMSEITITAGILANLADDMRHLQRTEIDEVGEAFGEKQVGSSTMPHKHNPISFEFVKSVWKIVVPRLITVFMDQISEHQRDLTNSASSRTYGEIVAYVVVMTRRLTGAMKKLVVSHANLNRNLATQRGIVVAEPLYIILAALGHPDAHEKVRTLTQQAAIELRPLEDVAWDDKELLNYLHRMTANQRRILRDPSLYTGIAAKKARKVAEDWKTRLGL